MKTIVLQSFRTIDVPGWITRCMASVRTWADGNGWDYAFMDDRFFALAPEGVRERCGANLYAVTDVCRLVWIKQALAGGYDRAVWADADLLVFAPNACWQRKRGVDVIPAHAIQPVHGPSIRTDADHLSAFTKLEIVPWTAVIIVLQLPATKKPTRVLGAKAGSGV